MIASARRATSNDTSARAPRRPSASMRWNSRARLSHIGPILLRHSPNSRDGSCARAASRMSLANCLVQLRAFRRQLVRHRHGLAERIALHHRDQRRQPVAYRPQQGLGVVGVVAVLVAARLAHDQRHEALQQAVRRRQLHFEQAVGLDGAEEAAGAMLEVDARRGHPLPIMRRAVAHGAVESAVGRVRAVRACNARARRASPTILRG